MVVYKFDPWMNVVNVHWKRATTETEPVTETEPATESYPYEVFWQPLIRSSGGNNILCEETYSGTEQMVDFGIRDNYASLTCKPSYTGIQRTVHIEWNSTLDPTGYVAPANRPYLGFYWIQSMTPITWPGGLIGRYTPLVDTYPNDELRRITAARLLDGEVLGRTEDTVFYRLFEPTTEDFSGLIA